MGISILEMVLRQLRENGFTASVAYPGQKFPRVSEPVAVVHMEKVDRANLTVTMEVSLVAPAALGGTACELEALRVTEVLRWSGAVCVQNGCTYDGVAQVYVVPVLATYTGITEEESCTLGAGFSVYLDGKLQTNVVSAAGEESWDQQAEYAMGECAPVGVHPGERHWSIALEELVPAGNPENEEPGAVFEMKIETAAVTEIYRGCRWTSVKREYAREGMRRTRKGLALSREVA